MTFWDKVAAKAAEYEKIKVVKVTGDSHAERTLAKFKKKGYTVQNHDVRKAVWSPLTGLFTGKNVHTFTFVKGNANASNWNDASKYGRSY